MQKIGITKNDGSVKVAEVNRNILAALNSYSFKTRKPVDFKKKLSYSLSSIPLTICNPNKSRRHTAKSKLKMFFFYLGFLSRTFTIHWAAGEGGG